MIAAASLPLPSRFLVDRPTSLRPRRLSVACSATATERPPAASLYEVLGVTAGATAPEIKAAYRRLARTCHPDVVAAGRREPAPSADEFMRIHSAYATLSDPGQRADYDRRMFFLHRRSATPFQASSSSTSPVFSGQSRRTWETDQCW